MRRIGLTGSTGMLGRHLRAALNNIGAEVVGVSKSGLDRSQPWELSEWLSNDRFDELFGNVDAVIHAGAIIPSSNEPVSENVFNINVRSCANIAQWALSRNTPIVFISSGSVFSHPDSSPIFEGSPRGWNELSGGYGMSKLIAEDMLDRFRSQGLKVAIARPSALFGCGGPKTKLLHRFLDTAARGEVISLVPPVTDRIDFLHAADFSNAIIKIIEKNFWGTLNFSSGRPVSIYELACECVAAAGSGHVEVMDIKKVYEPCERFFLATERAWQKLEWEPYIGIKEGLSMTLREQLLPKGSPVV